MINVKFDDRQFMKDMKNIIDYSIGFLDGAKAGKTEMLKNVGDHAIQILKDFIDMNARMDPQKLHHVYEWYQVGSPDARLFDIEYTVANGGLTINSSFRQSTSVKAGSSTPFYDKARIMENGIPVTIRPKKTKALKFEVDGETVFTKNEVMVENPGGEQTVNAFENTFNMFFDKYFNQSFLKVTGIYDSIRDVTLFKKYLNSGSKSGRNVGYRIGYRWISNAGKESL